MEWILVLHEWVCKHGHIKYDEIEPEICNICGNREFKLVAKNAGVVDKNGFSRTPQYRSSEE